MDQVEQWRPVPGLERIEVSDLGNVRAEWGGSVQPKTVAMHKGYPSIVYRKRKRTYRACVHTLVLMAFHGDKPFPEAMARHLDGDPTNNRSGNLAWGTAQENHADAVRHGTSISLRRGIDHPRGKLSDRDVAVVRSLRASGVPFAPIAKAFGICREYARAIANGRERAAVSA